MTQGGAEGNTAIKGSLKMDLQAKESKFDTPPPLKGGRRRRRKKTRRKEKVRKVDYQKYA